MNRLRIAWVHHTEDALERPATTIECTPIVVDGVMYITTAQLQVRALDAASGEVLWNFDPAGGKRRRGSAGVNRGVTYWQDPANDKDQRIFSPIQDQLFCLNAVTGKLIPGFANEGVIDLKKDFDPDRAELPPSTPAPRSFIRTSSSPAVVAGMASTLRRPATSGPTMRALENASGSFTPSPSPASSATTPGRVTPGSVPAEPTTGAA